MRRIANLVVAAILLAAGLVVLPPAAAAQTEELDPLFETLASPDLEDWQSVEDEIIRHWSRSGSSAMDLLLQRGTEAMEAGDFDTALEHLTALTDHAPDFAEGWNTRATVLFQKERYGLAIEDIKRTLALNPRHFGALSGLGIIMEELGEDEIALGAFRAAVSIHPHRPNLNEALKRLERKVLGRTL